MTIEEHINYWIESAENDLKAIYVKLNSNSIPPKIHNLSRLAELSKLSPENEIEIFLVLANKFHLEGRYPEYKSEFYKTCTKEFAESNFVKVKEVYKWLKSQLN